MIFALICDASMKFDICDFW